MQEFVPLYYGDRLRLVNPYGAVGVATLWSRVDYILQRLQEAGVNLDPASSPIAVIGTLYGNGLRELLRNLLYNPQIRLLVIYGHDRSGSRQELENFFQFGLEPAPAAAISYLPPAAGVQVQPCRIRQTNRVLDDLVRPEDFSPRPEIHWLGDPQDAASLGRVREFFAAWRAPDSLPAPRRDIPLPQVEVPYFPSNPRAFQVVRDTPLEAWREALHLLTRFGRRVALKKGERLELQHVKVVIEKPRFEPEADLRAANFDPQRLRRYQADLLRDELRPDEAYHYGHRLRAYFGQDNLERCAQRLRRDPEDRKAYLTLWDNARDLGPAEGRPCLASLYFRKSGDALTMSATFRTHNAMDAWLLNAYGLMAVLEWVAGLAGLAPGSLVIISHSLGLDPKELDRALMIIGHRPFKVRLDPMGYFRVSLDGDALLVEHRFEDVTLKEYRGKTAVALQHQLARDGALSDINHALYLGRQLARAEMALQWGQEFIQD
jgi:thymidylate synthase